MYGLGRCCPVPVQVLAQPCGVRRHEPRDATYRRSGSGAGEWCRARLTGRNRPRRCRRSLFGPQALLGGKELRAPLRNDCRRWTGPLSSILSEDSFFLRQQRRCSREDALTLRFRHRLQFLGGARRRLYHARRQLVDHHRRGVLDLGLVYQLEAVGDQTKLVGDLLFRAVRQPLDNLFPSLLDRKQRAAGQGVGRGGDEAKARSAQGDDRSNRDGKPL